MNADDTEGQKQKPLATGSLPLAKTETQKTRIKWQRQMQNSKGQIGRKSAKRYGRGSVPGQSAESPGTEGGVAGDESAVAGDRWGRVGMNTDLPPGREIG